MRGSNTGRTVQIREESEGALALRKGHSWRLGHCKTQICLTITSHHILHSRSQRPDCDSPFSHDGLPRYHNTLLSNDHGSIQLGGSILDRTISMNDHKMQGSEPVHENHQIAPPKSPGSQPTTSSIMDSESCSASVFNLLSLVSILGSSSPLRMPDCPATSVPAAGLIQLLKQRQPTATKRRVAMKLHSRKLGSGSGLEL